ARAMHLPQQLTPGIVDKTDVIEVDHHFLVAVEGQVRRPCDLRFAYPLMGQLAFQLEAGRVRTVQDAYSKHGISPQCSLLNSMQAARDSTFLTCWRAPRGRD